MVFTVAEYTITARIAMPDCVEYIFLFKNARAC